MDKPGVDSDSSATDTAAPVTPERDDQSAQAAVEALLFGPPKGPAAEPEREPDQAQADESPLSLDDLAERLQVDKAKLYETKVPIADGEPRSLGELKDAFRTVEQLKTDREALEADRGKQQAESRQMQQELEALLSLIPREVINQILRSGALEQATQARETALQTDREALLKAVPDWADPVIKTAEYQAMAEHIAPFGFSKADLDNVSNNGLLRYVRHNMKRERELAAVKAKAPELKKAVVPKANKPVTPAQAHGRLKAAVSMKRIQPLQAVEQLLRGQGNGS